MDTWRIEEALALARDGFELTPLEAARMEAEHIHDRERRDLRNVIASALLSIARRLDPEAERTAVAARGLMPARR